jgi:hypothetical protein
MWEIKAPTFSEYVTPDYAMRWARRRAKDTRFGDSYQVLTSYCAAKLVAQEVVPSASNRNTAVAV